MRQKIIVGCGIRQKIADMLKNSEANSPLIVCNYVSEEQKLDDILLNADLSFVYFKEFASNPRYEDVCSGVSAFNKNGCDSIIAIGGGSAIDVAKCIKLFCKMDKKTNYLQQEYTDSGIPLLAIPTTAGTGSESTRHAVIYYDGVKQSITHESIIPDYAVLDAELLRTLPLYQKKCTMLDALCQGIESWWSVNSTDESKAYSKAAVEGILRNMEQYLSDPNDMEAAERIITASNYAGRAINITQTTAPHAMSYKLTSLYSIPHGQAVAICMPKVWKYMTNHLESTADTRGEAYLKDIFCDIAECMGFASSDECIAWFEDLLVKLNIKSPRGMMDKVTMLAESVNPVRLKNNPIKITEEAFISLYRSIAAEE